MNYVQIFLFFKKSSLIKSREKYKLRILHRVKHQIALFVPHMFRNFRNYFCAGGKEKKWELRAGSLSTALSLPVPYLDGVLHRQKDSQRMAVLGL